MLNKCTTFRMCFSRILMKYSCAYHNRSILAEADELQKKINNDNIPENLTILDCTNPEAFRRAHIPGAVRLPIPGYLKGDNNGNPISASEFQTLLKDIGVGSDSHIIVYDDVNSLFATRFWWLSKYYGFEKVQVLNGGWNRWVTENRPISCRSTKIIPNPNVFEPKIENHRIANYQYVMDVIQSDKSQDQIIDNRSIAERSGIHTYGNPRQGAIPKSIHLEWTELFNGDDKRMIKSEREILELLNERNISLEQPLITHCQMGIRAAYAAFILELVGATSVRNYEKSMHGYTRISDSPLE